MSVNGERATDARLWLVTVKSQNNKSLLIMAFTRKFTFAFSAFALALDLHVSGLGLDASYLVHIPENIYNIYIHNINIHNLTTKTAQTKRQRG